MSATTIKAALVSLLGAVTELKHVDGHYPRLADEMLSTDLPRAVIWRRGNGEMRTAAGGPANNIGYKQARWRFTIHVFGVYTEPLTEGAGWDICLDAIYTKLRANPTLNSLADVTNVSKVIRAEEIEEEDLQPQMGEIQHSYNAYITITVEEWIRA